MNMFNKIRLKSEEEIEIIQKSSLLVGKTLAEVAKYIKPGVPLLYLDRIAETYIRDNGGVPSFKGYNGFPASLCLSVNDVVVHGIPKEGMVLNEGDIISVDCGAYMNGYHGDYAYTFAVGHVSEEKRLLMERIGSACDVDNLSERSATACIDGKYLEFFGIGSALSSIVDRSVL